MKDLKLRYILSFTLFVICFLAFTAQSEAEAALKYGGQFYPGEFVLSGQPEIWNRYGVEVEHILFSSGTENNQALISGKVDINCGSDSKTASLFSVMEDEIIILASIQKGDRYATVVPADSTVSSWHDLKGKTVATRLGSGAEQVLRRYFNEQPDISWEDFRWVNLKLEDMPVALESGRIDSFTAWEPTPSIAESQGTGKIMLTYGNVSPVPVCLHTTRSFAERNRDQVVRFLAAHLEKAELIRTSPEKAAEIAAATAGKQGSTIPPDTFERVFKRIDFSLTINEELTRSIEDTARFLYENRKINNIPKISYDASYLEEAKKLYREMKKESE